MSVNDASGAAAGRLMVGQRYTIQVSGLEPRAALAASIGTVGLGDATATASGDAALSFNAPDLVGARTITLSTGCAKATYSLTIEAAPTAAPAAAATPTVTTPDYTG